MSVHRRTMAALSITALASSVLVGLAPSSALAAAAPPTVTVTMSGKTLSISTGTSLHAGRYLIKVVVPSGDDTLQLAKLAAPGYSFAQASKDVNSAFGGNIAAIRRVDKNIHWLGGAEGTPGHPGMFVETLYAGSYVFLAQNANAVLHVRVFGTPRGQQTWVNQTSTISTTPANRFSSPPILPRAGWTLFRDGSDEPHFLSMQQVKPGTTLQEVLAFLHSPQSQQQQQPPWALPATTSAGVISPHTQILFHYSLPAGRYVLFCFWPDDRTGMPHALMGMVKLVTLA